MSSTIDRIKLTQYVKMNEGFSPTMYKDTEGIWTVGIGFNLEEGFTMEECMLILDHRLGNLVDNVARAIPSYNRLDSVRKIVLVDMAYNLGIRGLLKFRKMLAAIQRRDFEDAAKELLNSRYAAQVGGRAQRNARMMETGEWYDAISN